MNGNMLRALIDNIPDAMYVKDKQGRFVIANVHTARSLGEKPDETAWEDRLRLLSTETCRSLHADEQEVIRSERPCSIVKKMGPTAWGTSTQSSRQGAAAGCGWLDFWNCGVDAMSALASETRTRFGRRNESIAEYSTKR